MPLNIKIKIGLPVIAAKERYLQSGSKYFPEAQKRNMVVGGLHIGIWRVIPSIILQLLARVLVQVRSANC